MDSLSPSPEESRIERGTVIANYVVDDVVGRGAEGCVYLARDSLLGRQVAIKTLRAAEEGETRGVEEARLLASLEHSHILRVYHARRHQGVWYIVFEFLGGGNLQARVQRVGALPAREALELMAQAASGLAFAHQAGIVHRDVKPHNMLLSERGELKLADFGLALDVRRDHRAHTMPVGTPAFLAPEVWTGGAATKLSDVYSLGVSLFFCLAGRPPFVVQRAEQLKRAHLELDPKLPSGVPSRVRDIVLAMMSKNPAGRPMSDEIAGALRSIALDHSTWGDQRRWSRRPAAVPVFVEGAPERAARQVIYEGRDSVFVTELGRKLGERPKGIELCAPVAADAALLLDVARDSGGARFDYVARLVLPRVDASLQEVIDNKLELPRAASMREASERLFEPASDTVAHSIVEVFAPRGASPEQRADIRVLADVASERGAVCVTIVPTASVRPEPGSATALEPIEGFVRVFAFESLKTEGEIEHRLRRFLEIATEGRLSFSADGLRFAAHLCRSEGRWWARLAQDALCIAGASKLPALTTWAVLGARVHGGPFNELEDVPAEWRKRPLLWPTQEISAELERVRKAETEAATIAPGAASQSAASQSGQYKATSRLGGFAALLALDLNPRGARRAT